MDALSGLRTTKGTPMSDSHVMITRRALLRSAVLAAPLLVAACGAPAAPPTAPEKPAAPGDKPAAPAPAAPAAAAPGQGSRPRLVYWVYQFLKSSDDARYEFGKKWAEQNNVDLEMTLVPQKDFLTKIAAAIEAKAAPDIIENQAVVLRGR